MVIGVLQLMEVVDDGRNRGGKDEEIDSHLPVGAPFGDAKGLGVRENAFSGIHDLMGESKFERGRMRVESDQAGALPFERHGKRAAHESQSNDPHS